MEPRTILVTGANRGLGIEFVKQFLKMKKPPLHIFATCRDPDGAKELKKLASGSDSVNIVKLDLDDLETVKTAATEVDNIAGSDGLNLLINNAGIYYTDGLSSLSPERLLESYKVNVVGPTIVAQKFVPLLKRAAKNSALKGQSCSKAAIINISSGYGSINESTSGGVYPYRQSKAALNMTTKVLANDLKADKILVMSICPGWVRTDMGGAFASTSPQESISKILKVLSTATEKDTGTFRSRHGSMIQW